MRVSSQEYHVAQHFACALMYGDLSGLSDVDVENLTNFLDSIPASGFWDFPDCQPDFSRCEIAGLIANTVPAVYTILGG